MEEKKKALTEIIINNKKELTIKEEKRKLGYNKPKRNKKKRKQITVQYLNVGFEKKLNDE